MKILGVSGSLQMQSGNRALLHDAAELLAGRATLRIFEGLGDLPHFNPDQATVPPAVHSWRQALTESDALLVASPEYGHSLPGVLKNAIDWVIGSGELERKIVAVTAATSSGDRGQRGLNALLGTLRAVSARVVGGRPQPRGDRAALGRLLDELLRTVGHASETAPTPPVALLPERTALLCIDVQQGFDDPVWGPRNNPTAEQQIVRLLGAFRRHGRAVIHVRHDSTDANSPLRPDRPGNALKPEATPLPGEPLVAKSVNSAFIGTQLKEYLDGEALTALVLVGFITNHCVSTTARMASNYGYQVTVVSDACATFDFTDERGFVIPADTMHRVGLTELRGEFATIASTDEVLGRLGS